MCNLKSIKRYIELNQIQNHRPFVVKTSHKDKNVKKNEDVTLEQVKNDNKVTECLN